jgi:hypothetical protein
MSQTNYTFEGTDLRDGAMQKVTEKRVWPQIQHGHFMWKRFGQKRGPSDVNIRKREIVHRLYDGQVPTFRPELTSLPRTIPEKEIRSEYTFTKMLRGVSFSPEAMEQMKQPSSLMGMAERLESYGDLIRSELARAFYGDQSAAVAVLDSAANVSASGSTRTITVLKNSDTYGGVGSRGVADLKIGSDYDVIETATYTVQAVIRVLTKASSTTFTATLLSGTLADATPYTGIIVPPGSRANGSNTSYAPAGIAYHVTTATSNPWQTLDLTDDTYQELRSTTKDLDGAGLTIGYVNYLEDAVRIRRAGMENGGMDKTLIVSGVGQHAKLKAYLQSFKRADWSETVLKTGARDVENQLGNRWEVDIQCPDSRVYNLWEDDFAMAVLKELSYVDTGGGSKFVLRPDGNSTTPSYTHVYDAWLWMLYQFVGRNPFKQAALVDIGVDDIIAAADTCSVF